MCQKKLLKNNCQNPHTKMSHKKHQKMLPDTQISIHRLSNSAEHSDQPAVSFLNYQAEMARYIADISAFSPSQLLYRYRIGKKKGFISYHYNIRIEIETS